MKYQLAAMLVVLGVILAACARTASPPPAADAGNGEMAELAAARSAPPPAADPAVPPKDAQWTLYCRSIAGDGHVLLAKQFKDQLVKSTGLPNWYVIHGERDTTLYYGYYRAIDKDAKDSKDRRDGARAQDDRKRIQALVDSQKNIIFPRCLFVEINSPDPDGPPEWNLLNKDANKDRSDPTRAFWSLEIAAYRGSPDRKQAAAEAVKAARAQGVEAYYYHGPSISSVCVGAWPMDAIKRQETDAARTGEGERTDQPLLILPFALPEGGPDKVTVDGQPVKAVVSRAEVQDPTLLAAMRQFPAHSVNGMEIVKERIDPRNGQKAMAPDPSYLVQIPRPERTLLSRDPRETAAERPRDPEALPVDAPVVPPTPSVTPGTGRLRSIGDR